MIEAERDASLRGERDEEMIAFHEAGHAVAMWKLGLGVSRVTIEPVDGLDGFADPAYERFASPGASESVRRSVVEQNALFIHAGDVAARLLRPDVSVGQAATDHRLLHGQMYAVESDASVRAAWCMYLWQRAYDYLAWLPRWYLVAGLARELLAHRTLDGKQAETYLSKAEERLRHDPSMPNAVFVDEVTYVCSPWHRAWHEQSVAAAPAPKRTRIPETIVDLSANADLRPVRGLCFVSGVVGRRRSWRS